jgi:hypothetical protein
LFFLFEICEGGEVGHYSQEDLAKFGYKSERKVKKSLRMALRVSDVVVPIVNIWRFEKSFLLMGPF